MLNALLRQRSQRFQKITCARTWRDLWFCYAFAVWVCVQGRCLCAARWQGRGTGLCPEPLYGAGLPGSPRQVPCHGPGCCWGDWKTPRPALRTTPSFGMPHSYCLGWVWNIHASRFTSNVSDSPLKAETELHQIWLWLDFQTGLILLSLWLFC